GQRADLLDPNQIVVLLPGALDADDVGAVEACVFHGLANVPGRNGPLERDLHLGAALEVGPELGLDPGNLTEEQQERKTDQAEAQREEPAPKPHEVVNFSAREEAHASPQIEPPLAADRADPEVEENPAHHDAGENAANDAHDQRDREPL